MSTLLYTSSHRQNRCLLVAPSLKQLEPHGLTAPESVEDGAKRIGFFYCIPHMLDGI